MPRFLTRQRNGATEATLVDSYVSWGIRQSQKLSVTQQTRYIKLMFTVIAQGLVAASEHDAVIAETLRAYPVGLRIRMQVFPDIASFTVTVTPVHTLRLVKDENKGKNGADVTITFKHINIALLVLTFQESTAQAFANDRMTVDGDIAYATRFVRVLNQLQALILPKVIAKRAIKRYPEISLLSKVNGGGQIYRGMLGGFAQRFFNR